ncbi:glycine cleavage system protein GcvH [Propionibacterium australiense]|uniref:Glycine cleavage system H protein n=1 Tax=Propionibacterium australiense TaxID=119981 RepID=A0A383SAU0_9ACTN|nr:glycine cleavage system protein GcvH [Propionibacterium australiense]RLP06876.1 glycine cleavage system protein GcvH [Propionibacterium australiense]RLP08854.1 glycine cleavage system protein GcvH [Propionibacterium australiense]SYZ34336.1 Glycine cleavage system H-protein/Simiate [Propionibacterium australiense]VEH90070.1 Glycine cleavage system H protein [Propionibacterium australiense]
MAQFPAGLRYSSEHEWVRFEEGSAIVRVGITDGAVDALGDVVHVDLPTVGNELVAGDACGGLESTTSVRDVHSPVTGVVSAVNETVIAAPETINASPYGEGWLFEVELAEQSGTDDLLDAAGRAGLVQQ